MFITEENFYDPEAIENFEESDNNISDLQNEIMAPIDVLIKLGVLNPKIKPAEEEKEKPSNAQTKKGAKGAPPKKSGKPEQKQKPIFLDEHELKKFRLDKLKSKILGYLKFVAEVVKSIISSYNTEVINAYFEKIHTHVLNGLKDQEFRGPLEEIIFTLFSRAPYQPINSSANILHDIFLSKICGIALNSKLNGEKLTNVIQKLQTLEFENISLNYSIIIYNVCQHILIYNNIDTKIKNKALENIIKIGKTAGSELIGKEILSMMIENLDAICTFVETKNLLIFLLEKYGDDHYDDIYSHILNQGDLSKEIFLESFLVLDKKQINGTFDKFNKLMILKLDENEEIVKLANSVLEKYLFTPTIEDLNNYEYNDFITIQSKDSIDKFCKNISSKIYHMFHIKFIYIRIHRYRKKRFY